MNDKEKYQIFKQGLEEEKIRLPWGKGEIIYEIYPFYNSENEKVEIEFNIKEFWFYLKKYHLEKASGLNANNELIYLKRLPPQFKKVKIDNIRTFQSQFAADVEINVVSREADFAIEEIEAHIQDIERYIKEVDEGQSKERIQKKKPIGKKNIGIYEDLTVDGVILLHYFSSSYSDGKYTSILKSKNGAEDQSGFAHQTLYNRFTKVARARENYCNYDSKTIYNSKKSQLYLVKEKLLQLNENEAAALCHEWLKNVIKKAISAINGKAPSTGGLFLNVEKKLLDQLEIETFTKKSTDVKK